MVSQTPVDVFSPRNGGSMTPQISDATRLEVLATELPQIAEGGISSLEEPIRKIDEVNDPSEALESMRTTYGPFLDVLRGKRGHFCEEIDEIVLRMKRPGILRLPNELLCRIFFFASNQLDSAIALSHVCKRFRLLVNGMRTIWNRFILYSDVSPQLNMTIAERSGFQSLKASITATPGLPDAACRTILDLREHLEELTIRNFTPSLAKTMRNYVAGSDFLTLRTLTISHECIAYRNDVLRSVTSERASFPSLQVLFTESIPHPSWASNLVECDLALSLSSLLSDLLAFLSSASRLRELTLTFREISVLVGAFPDHDSTLGSISVPSLVSLSFRRPHPTTCSIFMDKIVPFSVRRLGLHRISRHTDRHAITNLMKGRNSLREVKTSNAYLDELLWMIDQAEVNIETVVITNSIIGEWSLPWTAPNSKSLRLLHFERCLRIDKEVLFAVRNDLQISGLGDVQFEFRECRGMWDGIFGRDNLESAFCKD